MSLVQWEASGNLPARFSHRGLGDYSLRVRLQGEFIPVSGRGSQHPPADPPAARIPVSHRSSGSGKANGVLLLTDDEDEDEESEVSGGICYTCEEWRPDGCFAEASLSCRDCDAVVRELHGIAKRQRADDVLSYALAEGNRFRDMVRDYKGKCPRRDGRRLPGSKRFDLRSWFLSQQPVDTPGKRRRI